MSRITLGGMRFHAFHGVLPQEKKEGNDFEVKVKVRGDFEQAAIDDDLAKTVDYSEIYNIASEVMNSGSRNLIETVASDIADKIINNLKCDSVTVEIKKMNPPNCGNAAFASYKVTKKR